MKASVFIGISVDGFIARPNGEIDFLTGSSDPAPDPESYGYYTFFATVDALVMGRKTFETVLAFDKWPYGDKPVFVLSSRELPDVPAGAVVERMSGEPGEIIAQLEARNVEHIYVDGGDTIQRFLRAGLITRLIISRVPVLIGSGTPLFGPLQADIPLRHIATRELPGGMVQSEYLV